MTLRVRVAIASALLFVLALLVRGLYLSDGVALLYTAEQDGTRMARRYDESALSILQGDGILFPTVWDKARTGLASRPPGYAMFLASIYATFGRSFPIVAAVQDVLTSVAVLLVFGFAYRLGGLLTGVLAGFLAAVSPHIAATSNLILADAVASIPLLMAFTVVWPAVTVPSSYRTQALRCSAMGVLIGVGVWLRPNVVLLGPFTAVVLFFLLGRNKRALVLSSLVALVSLFVVAPISLRNWMVFGEFVPVSINGGITLWQGVADAGGREYGARVWDKQVMAEEAERYGRPDYLLWWAEPDGIARDHDRYRRAMQVIKERPLWYAQAMARRMGSMLSFSDGPKALLLEGAVVEASDIERVPLAPAPGLDVRIDESAFANRAGMASFLRSPLRLLHRGWFIVPV
ncbi:MAG: glycosyltransferase family 39 protein, partial [Vicinamibacteria bacterium]|nr:glycosyltransferase family 39 protein [Vicinamibacteria bacterium]